MSVDNLAREAQPEAQSVLRPAAGPVRAVEPIEESRLVGDRSGLHPVAVLFAVLAGGHLFGFFGILLALPVAAVIAVVLRHAHDEYLQSIFYRQ